MYCTRAVTTMPNKSTGRKMLTQLLGKIFGLYVEVWQVIPQPSLSAHLGMVLEWSALGVELGKLLCKGQSSLIKIP